MGLTDNPDKVAPDELQFLPLLDAAEYPKPHVFRLLFLFLIESFSCE